jgi:hypothetical protein
MSIEAESNISELSKSSSSKHPLWYLVPATAIFVVIVALIAAAQHQPEIDFLAGNALPPLL